MNAKQKKKFTLLRAALFFTLGLASLALLTPSTVFAESTTWQKFIEKKCGNMSADAAERCVSNLETRLKNKCGKPKETDKYTTCWRQFIKNNDGAAGPNSSPFEEEVSGSSSGSGCGGVETAIIKCDADNSGATKDNGLWQLLIIVINIMTAGVGIVAVGGIVYGAILYTTAEDKADQVKSAVDIIVNVVIGLILFALMWAGLNFIVPGGVFN